MASSFTLFPLLPQEIQIMIWEEALAARSPLTIQIRRAPLHPGQTTADIEHPSYLTLGIRENWTTRCNEGHDFFPGIMSASRLSRECGSKRLELALGGVDNYPVWVDWKTDKLSVQFKFLLDFQAHDPARYAIVANQASLARDFENVRHVEERALALCSATSFRFAANGGFDTARFLALPNLELLTIVNLRHFIWNDILRNQTNRDLKLQRKYGLRQIAPIVQRVDSRTESKFDMWVSG